MCKAQYYQQAVSLLKALIQTPSVSKKEDKTAQLLLDYYDKHHIKAKCVGNNIISHNRCYHPDKPTILLVSHHDTVPPSESYTKDPFKPEIIGNKLYGLGANDAGGALVSLLMCYQYFYNDANLPFNLVFCAAAEEEISGKNGLEKALPQIGKVDFAIVGEPTSMQMAISEKGLMVCDCVAYGQSGHAARNEGDNAIFKAISDIQWLKSYCFEKTSSTLGEVKMTPTVIHAGSKHNVVPDHCEFVVDVRTTDAYDNKAVLAIMKANMQSVITPRSMRIEPTRVPLEHPVVKSLMAYGLPGYGSPTTSDQAVLTCPSVKLSPGDSARSHTADEFIYLEQIKEGVAFFIDFFTQLKTEDVFNSKKSLAHN